MPLCALASPAEVCRVCVTGKDKVLFICAIENKRPSPALGWAAGQRVNSFLHTQRGSGGKEERARPVLGHWAVCISLPVPQDTNRYLHFADLHPRFVGFPSHFQCPVPGQRNSAVSLQLLLCQISSGTNRPLNPRPSIEA